MEIGTSLATEIVKCLGQATWEQARYSMCFDHFVEEFNGEKKNLEAKIEDMEKKAKILQENTVDVGRFDKLNLDEAIELQTKADELLKHVQLKKTCCYGHCPNLYRRDRLGRQVAEKTEDMKKLNAQIQPQQKLLRAHTLVGMEYYSSEDFILFSSTKKASYELLEALKDANIRRVGLCGMGGSGKTTLVKEVGKKAEKLFDKVIFITVSKNFEVRTIQRSIADQLNLTLTEGNEPERAKRLFMRFTVIKKILIILDDVWGELKFNDIGIPYDSNHKGCWILLTTRLRDVCVSLNCREVPLGLLSDEEAWKLFQKHSGVNEDISGKSLKGLPRVINNACKGLPIAVAAFAKALKSTEDLDDWKDMHDLLKHCQQVDIANSSEDPYGSLKFSFDHLKDKEAKDLFLLCSLFPEDSEIKKEDLIRIGAGLGFFGNVSSFNDARRKGRTAIRKLLNSFLLLQAKDGLSVVLHDILRAVALKIAGKEFQTILENMELPKNVATGEITKLYCRNIGEFPLQLKCPNLDILIVSKDGKGSLEMPDEFINEMRGLKVLTIIDKALWQNSTLLLPNSIWLLKCLRTLCIRGCRLDFSFSLQHLQHVEMLEFCDCSIMQLPNDIAELKELKLLDVSRCRVRGNPYEALGNCAGLEELYFSEIDLDDEELKDQNLAEFFGKNDYLTKLKRYNMQFGARVSKLKDDVKSGFLSMRPYSDKDTSISTRTIKALAQRAEVLFLENIPKSCESIVPDIVYQEGDCMEDLIELFLSNCMGIKCLIDNTNQFNHIRRAFAKLQKLRITRMSCLEGLCLGNPPCDLFKQLHELECSHLPVLSSLGKQELSSLVILKLQGCPKLESLFTPSVAVSLAQLKELKITKCHGLKFIIGDDDEENITDNDQNPYASLFTNLKELVVGDCEMLEYLIPLSFAQGLGNLEVLTLYLAPNLKYAFAIRGSCSQNDINLPNLKKLELLSLEEILSFYPENDNANFQEGLHLKIGKCPNFKATITTNAAKVGPEVEVQEQLQQHNEASRKAKLCFIPSGTSAVAQNMKNWVSAPITQARYSLSFNRYVEHLQTETERLKSATASLQDRLERETLELDSDVKEWLDNADTLIEKAEKLQQKAIANQSCFFGNFPNWIQRYCMGKQAAAKIDALTKHNQCCEFQNFSQRASLPHKEYFQGDFMFSDSIRSIYYSLLESLKEDDISVIGLHGTAGCGKTTLAKQVAKEAEQLFDRVIFVAVSSNPDNVQKIQGKIAASLDMMLMEEAELETAKRLFKRLSSGERILVILDNVWDRLNLEDIGIPFGVNHKGCSVLIITRSEQVCIMMDCQMTFPIPPLTDEEAWFLLQRHAHITKDTNDSLKDVAKEVVRECGGLSIALAAVGSTLKGKTEDDWKESLEMLQSATDNEADLARIYRCLQLSYHNLVDENAKKLFLLCSVFPEDFEIQEEDLMRYRIALGLFGEVSSYERARDQVREAKEKLIDSCLLLKEDEGQCVKIHGLFRVLAHSIANKEIVMLQGVHEWRLVNAETIRYLWCENVDKLPNEFYFPKLEFLYFGVSKNSILPIEFFKGMTCLRVLVCCCKSNSPNEPNLTLQKSIVSLPNLVGLFLEGWRLGDMSFVVRLNRLEALVLRSCSFQEIPNEIIELRMLQLLELSKCRIERKPYEAIGRCSQLQELYFLENSCLEWNDQGKNDAILFQENEISLNLDRYHIQTETFFLSSNFDFSTSRVLYLGYFNVSTSNTTFKNLVQRAEVLSLANFSGGCENIIPDMVEKVEGINGLIELQLILSDEIKCITGTTDHVGAFFPYLIKLKIVALTHMEALCSGPTPAGSFQKLKKLELSECHLLESLFTVAVAQCLEMLQVLNIYYCKRLMHIIWNPDTNTEMEEKIITTNDDGRKSISAFPKLEELYVCYCKSLEYLGEHWLLNLENLKVLNVSFCSNLKSLFTPSTAKTMMSLEQLFIENCGSLEEVFGVPYGEDGQALTLPRLKMVRFTKLPNLLEISRGFKLQHVIDAEVDDCINIQNLLQGQNSGLTKLTIRGLQGMEAWCRGPTTASSFEKLKELEFCECPSFKYLLTIVVAQSLKMLQVLKIYKCQRLKHIIWNANIDEDAKEEIIPIDDYQKNISAFPKLEELYVSECEVLEYLGGHWLINLCNLKVLDIRYCSSLKSLFTASTVKTMTSLENLFIERCDSLMEVFGVPNGEDGQALVLPKLKILQFMRLPNLIRVSQGFKMQHGIDVEVDDCPKLRQPVDGFQNTSQGQTLAIFPELTKLKIRRLHNTESLCCGPTPADSFGKLKELELYDCPLLKSLFTVAVVQSLEMLQVLRIIKCDGLKHITWDDEAEQETVTTFSKLEELYVHNCKNLEYLGGYWLVNLSGLKVLDVRHCSSLNSLSTISTTKAMTSLRKLSIERCDSLKEVFGVPNGVDSQALTLPSLESLEFIRLPNLIEAFHGFKLQHVINVVVGGYFLNLLPDRHSDEIHCMTDTIGHVGAFFPGLTKLGIQKSHNIESLCSVLTPATSFENLKELHLWYCSSLKSLFTVAVAQSLQTLQFLNVSWCHRLKHIIWNANTEKDIFPIDDDQKYTSAFPNLEKFYVYGCRDLEYLEEHGLFNLCSLKELNVTNCERLKSLFTTLTAKTMTSLENLIIERCYSIKEVFGVPYDEDGQALTLPRLKMLRFLELPNLIEVSHGFELKHVIKPHIQHCPEFHGSVFSFHDPSQGKKTDERKCITDTTGHVGAFFPSMSKLRIQRLHDEESLHSFQPPICSFEKLKELELYNCPSLKSLFTVVIAQSLKMLQVLKIIECDKLKHIIWEDEANRKEEIITTNDDNMSISAFSKLEELYVRDCKNLEDLGGHWLFNLCDLKVLDVGYCSSLKSLFTISTAKTMTSLKKLFIERCESLIEVFGVPHGVDDQGLMLPNVKILGFMRLPNLIEASLGFKLQHEINVTVTDCPSTPLLPVDGQNPDEIQCITDTTCPVGAFFPGLSKLLIHGLHKIESLCYVPTVASSFEKLKELELCDCSSLESLFTVSIAQSLEMLQVLKILDCYRLKHIIWDANTDTEKNIISAFPKLEVLQVESCNELEYLGGHGRFNLCSLKKLNISNCKRLKSLFTTSTAKTMISLEKLSIQICDSLKEVFEVPYGEDDAALILPRLKTLRFRGLLNLIEVSPNFKLQHGIETDVDSCPYFRGPVDGFENMSQGQNPDFSEEKEGRELDSESADKKGEHLIGQSTSRSQKSSEFHNALAGTSIIINTASSSSSSSAPITALHQECRIPDDTPLSAIKASSSNEATEVHSVSKLKGTAIEELTLQTIKEDVHVQATLKIDQNVHGKGEDSQGQEFDSSNNAENAAKETMKESVHEQVPMSKKQNEPILLLGDKDSNSQTATIEDVNLNAALAATNLEYQTTVGGDNLKKMEGNKVIEQGMTQTGIPLTDKLESVRETPMSSTQKGLPSEKFTAKILSVELGKRASNSEPISMDRQEEAFKENRVSHGNLPTRLDLQKGKETIINILKLLEDYSYNGPRKEEKHEHPLDKVNMGAGSSGEATMELPSSVLVAQIDDINTSSVAPAPVTIFVKSSSSLESSKTQKVMDIPVQQEHPYVTPEPIPGNNSEDVNAGNANGDNTDTDQPVLEGRASLHALNETLFGATTTEGTSSPAPKPASPHIDIPEVAVKAAPSSSIVTSVGMISPLTIAPASNATSSITTVTPEDIDAALSQLVKENYLSPVQFTELKSFLKDHPSMFIPVSAMRNVRHLSWAYSCLLDLLPLLSRCKELNISDDEEKKLLEVLEDMQNFPFNKNWINAAEKYVASVLVFVKNQRPALSEANDQIEVARREILAIQKEINSKKSERAKVKKELEVLSKKMVDAMAIEAAASKVKHILLKTVPAPFI